MDNSTDAPGDIGLHFSLTIIDEKSMGGLDTLFWVEQRCRQIFPKSRVPLEG